MTRPTPHAPKLPAQSRRHPSERARTGLRVGAHRGVVARLEDPTVPDPPGVADPAGRPSTTRRRALTRNGQEFWLRTVEPGDLVVLADLLARQSSQSLYLRFMGASATATHHYVRILTDPTVTLDAVCAVMGDKPVGLGSSHPAAPGEAEVALLVDDRLHGHGLGTALLEELVRRARQRGLDRVVASTLGSNAAMIDVFNHLGLPLHARPVGSVLEVALDLAPARGFDLASAQRVAEATSASLRPLLQPEGVVVLGQRGATRAAGQLVDRLVLGGYGGAVQAVGAPLVAHGRVQGLRTPAEVAALVDLAVAAPPPGQAEVALRACLEARPRVVALLDPQPQALPAARLQSRLAEGLPNHLLGSTPGRRASQAKDLVGLAGLARERGVRLLGPASAGFASTHQPAVRVTAWSGQLDTGPVGAVAAAPLGIPLVSALADRDVGVSRFVDVGRAADVQVAEAVMLAATDPYTRLLVLALPRLTDTEDLTQAVVAARSAHALPILLFTPPTRPAVQAGAVHDVAEAATPGATPATTPPYADDEACVAAWCRQLGVTRVASLGELADAASLLAREPLPRASRVVVLSNDPRVGVRALDACSRQRLLPPDLTQHTEMRLRMLLGARARVGWLVEAHTATPAQLRDALTTLAEDPGVDGIVLTVTSPSSHWANELRRLVGQVCNSHPQLPCAVGMSGKRGVTGGMAPEMGTPMAAVTAMGSTFRTVRDRRLPQAWSSGPRVPGPARARAFRRLADVLVSGRPMTARETHKTLEDYGIPTVPMVSADGPETAVDAAELLRYPVAVAGRWEHRPNETETLAREGAQVRREARRGLTCPEEVRDAVRALYAAPDEPDEVELWPDVSEVRAVVVAERRPGWSPVLTVCRSPARRCDDAPLWVMDPVTDAGMETLVRLSGLAHDCRDAAWEDVWRPAEELSHIVRRVGLLMHNLPQVRRAELPVGASPGGRLLVMDAVLELS